MHLCFGNLGHYEVFIRKGLHNALFVVCLTQNDIKTETFVYRSLDYQKVCTLININFQLQI